MLAGVPQLPRPSDLRVVELPARAVEICLGGVGDLGEVDASMRGRDVEAVALLVDPPDEAIAALGYGAAIGVRLGEECS
jgi:hypothetical protein